MRRCSMGDEISHFTVSLISFFFAPLVSDIIFNTLVDTPLPVTKCTTTASPSPALRRLTLTSCKRCPPKTWRTARSRDWRSKLTDLDEIPIRGASYPRTTSEEAIYDEHATYCVRIFARRGTPPFAGHVKAGERQTRSEESAMAKDRGRTTTSKRKRKTRNSLRPDLQCCRGRSGPSEEEKKPRKNVAFSGIFFHSACSRRGERWVDNLSFYPSSVAARVIRGNFCGWRMWSWWKLNSDVKNSLLFKILWYLILVIMVETCLIPTPMFLIKSFTF